MNKRIRKIIALTVAFSAIMTVSPKTFLGLTSKPVYASSYTAKSGELTSLVVKSTNGDKLSLKDGYNGDTVKLSDEKEYFVKLTDDSEGIVINAEAKGSDRVVRIFLTDDNDAKAYKSGDKLYLGKGNTTIYVRTYASLSDFREAKDQDKDVSNCEEEYEINVKKTTGSSYEDENQDSIYLKDLSLNKGDITFLRQRTNYNVKVPSSVSEIKITAEPEDDSYRVRIDGSLVDEDDNYKKTVSLDKGKNEIKIKVTDDKDNQRVYTLNITRGSESDGDNNGDVYLSSLELDEADLGFEEDKTSYDVDVDEDVNKILVTAEPEDEEYIVTINGKEVNSNDDYGRKVSLSKGENTIKVVVEDEVEDEKRTYKITVNRGTSTDDEDKDDSDSDDNENNSSSNENIAGWVKVGDDWKYRGEDGQFYVNKWLYDKEQGVYCYFKEDGFRARGWLQQGGNWYLLDSKGAMLTGWQYIGGQWYYLQSDGAMKTGWLKEEKTIPVADKEVSTDKNGHEKASTSESADTTNKTDDKKEKTTSNTKKVETWYYLQSNGAMQTGWLLDNNKWYYMDTNGAMKTGWLLDNNKWYYMNLNGAMQTGWIINNNSKYYLDKSGVMVTGTKTIDGKEYKFTSSGALIS